MIADKETRKRIREIGIRKFADQIGMNKETVSFLANGKPVKPGTLAKVTKSLGSSLTQRN